MKEIGNFPPDVLRPELVRQHDLLKQVQLRQQSELLQTGIPTRFFQDLKKDEQRKWGGEPYIKVTRTSAYDGARENFWVTFYQPGSWTLGAHDLSDLVAYRQDNVVVPEALYEDLPYEDVIRMSDELHGLIAGGYLPDVDEYDFEIKNW